MKPPLPNSYWVRPGRFAAGEYPGDLDPCQAAVKLKMLLHAGINHFIDLTNAGELRPYIDIAEREARAPGVRVGYERFPITDVGVPRSREWMAQILDAIDAALDDRRTVYVHCWGGVGRTGTVVGCWLVRHGESGASALEQVAMWWRGVEKVCRIPRSPETCDQVEYVRNWVEPSA
ncbi:MAG: dual specificity protein phosphatase family protein [Gemmatimonadota bacterium]|nr:dual specificity protein phosphatase family protein [Gemmatimonadota bacterium]